MHRAVGVRQGHAQLLADVAQLVVLELGVLVAHQREGVQHRMVEGQLRLPEGPAEEGDVEGGVVGDQHRALAELREGGHHVHQMRLAPQHGRGDAGDLGDALGHRAAGVDQLGELRNLHAVLDAHRADLDDLVGVGVETRGLHIQHHVGRAVQGAASVALHDSGGVLDQVALAAGDQLDAVLLGRAEGLGEGLHHAVVGDGDGLVAPLRGLLDEVAGRCAGVHGGEGGVQVQLHALFGRGVLAHGLLRGLDVRGHQHHLVLELVVAVAAAHRDPVAVLQTRAQRVGLGLNGLGAVVAAALAAQKQLAVDRGGAVREGEGDDLRLTVLGLAHLEGGDLAAHHQTADVLGDLPHLDDGIVDHLAVERVRGRRGLLPVAFQVLRGVHGQHLGLLGTGGVDLLNAALVVAGALELHLHREVEESLKKLLEHAIHALHAQVLRALAAGDVHGEHVALKLPGSAAVQKVHRAGAVVGQQLLQ